MLARTYEIARSLALFPVDQARDILANDARAHALDPARSDAEVQLFVRLCSSALWRDATDLADAVIARHPPPNGPLARDRISFATFGAIHRRGLYLRPALGQLRAARQDLACAERIFPTYAATIASQALIAHLQGQAEEADRLALRALAAGFPGDAAPLAALSADQALFERRVDDAADALRRQMPARLRNRAQPMCAALAGALGGTLPAGEGAAALDRFLAMPDHASLARDYPGCAGLFIGWYARLGALDAAYDMAHKLVDNLRTDGVVDHVSLNHFWDWRLAAFRGDPRFGPLTEALGMMDCWHAHGAPDGYRLDGTRLVAA